MTMNSLIDMSGSLFAVTILNAIIGIGIATVYLVVREKITARKEAMGKRNETFNRKL